MSFVYPIRTPEFKGIIPPEGGWEESTYYVVHVGITENNVIHKAIFFTGFLDESGNPGGYNVVFNHSYDFPFPKCRDVYYMEAISKIDLVYEHGDDSTT